MEQFGVDVLSEYQRTEKADIWVAVIDQLKSFSIAAVQKSKLSKNDGPENSDCENHMAADGMCRFQPDRNCEFAVLDERAMALSDCG
ncbi:hypothetical protein KC340_g62 [Hortaea werneckii]|nr:hypothetical protein KC340_g62 [Hortaea werneckii]